MEINTKYNIIDRSKYQYFQLPKLLVYGEKYRGKLKAVDREAYAILLDRLNVSIKNNWVDEKGDIYFVFSNTQLMETLNVAKATLLSIKKTLKETGLLIEERTGRANRLYLLEPVPVNAEEAKYVLSLNDKELVDESLFTEEDKANISKGIVASQSKNKEVNQPEVQKLNIRLKKPSECGSKELSTDAQPTRSSKIEHQKFKNQTSEVQFLTPSKNNIVRKIDNDIDNDIDHKLNFKTHKNDKLFLYSDMFQKQFLNDLKTILNKQILDALEFLKDYEDIYEIYKIIYKAYTDLSKGKSQLLLYVSDNIKDQIKHIFNTVNLKHDDIGYAIHNALIRSCRYIYGKQQKQPIKNKENYYYNNIQNELIKYLQDNWVFDYETENTMTDNQNIKS